jgi:hypothetical protein
LASDDLAKTGQKRYISIFFFREGNCQIVAKTNIHLLPSTGGMPVFFLFKDYVK